jgi:hypothetical protein
VLERLVCKRVRLVSVVVNGVVVVVEVSVSVLGFYLAHGGRPPR